MDPTESEKSSPKGDGDNAETSTKLLAKTWVGF